MTDHRKCDSIINSSSPKQNTEGTQRQQTPFIHSAGGDNCALCQNVKSKPTPPKKLSLFSCARNIMQQTCIFLISTFQMRLHRFECWVEHTLDSFWVTLCALSAYYQYYFHIWKLTMCSHCEPRVCILIKLSSQMGEYDIHFGFGLCLQTMGFRGCSWNSHSCCILLIEDAWVDVRLK